LAVPSGISRTTLPYHLPDSSAGGSLVAVQCELSGTNQLKETLSCLLSSKLSLGKHLEIVRGSDTAHAFGEKEWYAAIRKDLDDDDVLRIIGPYDFRTIRDYGHARHNLMTCEGKQSRWSGQVMTGWFLVNVFVAAFGVALCILIVVVGLLRQNAVDIL
jgi:hypothetical protein